MPIYEYQCWKCGKNFEFEQSMVDKPKSKCPECKGKLQKLISLTGFQLRGSGWYKDGYTTPKKEPAPSPSANPAPAAGTSQPPPKKETPDPKPAKTPSSKKASS